MTYSQEEKREIVINPEELKKKNKYFLKGYVRCTNKIKRLETKLENIDQNIQSLKSQEITDMPRGGTTFTIEDMIIQKEETEERILNVSNQSIEIRRKIINKIDELEELKHVELLEAFFIENMTLDEIAEREGYSIRHAVRLYSEALRLINIDYTE